VDLLDRDAVAQSPEDQVVAVGRRHPQPGQRLLGPLRPDRLHVELASRHGLAERLGEGAAEREHLPHALHMGGQLRRGGGHLLEGEARDLDRDVVERGLEARRRDAGDLVGELVERVADREARGDLGDREAGRL
jgi:hypothetical protein